MNEAERICQRNPHLPSPFFPRKLTSPVLRWPHEERLDPSEPSLGCGFPVCAVIDMRPKRFVSMCNLTAWMKQEGMERRVVEVQKGACEDASEKTNKPDVLV